MDGSQIACLVITWRELRGVWRWCCYCCCFNSSSLLSQQQQNCKVQHIPSTHNYTITITTTKSTLFINKNARYLRQILHCSSFMVANSEPLDWDSRLLWGCQRQNHFLGAVCLLVCSLFFFLFHFRFWFFVCSLVCLYSIEVWLFVWSVDIFLNLQMIGHRPQVFFFFFWVGGVWTWWENKCSATYTKDFCEQTAAPDHYFLISKIVRWVGWPSSKRGLSQKICLQDREESRQNHFSFFLGVVCLLFCSLFFLSFSF